MHRAHAQQRRSRIASIINRNETKIYETVVQFDLIAPHCAAIVRDREITITIVHHTCQQSKILLVERRASARSMPGSLIYSPSGSEGGRSVGGGGGADLDKSLLGVDLTCTPGKSSNNLLVTTVRVVLENTAVLCYTRYTYL